MERDYQTEAKESTLEILRQEESTLLFMATGTGKTNVAGQIARQVLEQSDSDFLFLANRRELIRQTAATFAKIMPGMQTQIEMADQYATAHWCGCRVVLASKDSLSVEGRLKRFDPERFGTICIDECHHAIKRNGSYERVRKHFRPARVFGLSATPTRADGIAMGQTFGTVAFDFDILEAITKGWLVPIRQRYVRSESIDFSEVTLDESGDLREGELSEIMRREAPLQAVAQAAVKHSLDEATGIRRPTIIFCASTQHAADVAEIINRINDREGCGRAASIDYKTDDDKKEAIPDLFRKGRIKFLCNFGMLTEGFDAPETAVVVIARATKSEALYRQMVGRGTRPTRSISDLLNTAGSPEARRAMIRASSKPDCLVVDVVGVSGYHRLVGCADILGGRYDDEIIEEARKRVERGDGERTVDEELQAAKEAAEAKARTRRKNIVATVDFSEKMVDPFAALDFFAMREPPWMKGRRVTDGQRRVLENAGVDPIHVSRMNFFAAKQLIDKIFSRSKEGLCSFQLARKLVALGLSPDMTSEEATIAIYEAERGA